MSIFSMTFSVVWLLSLRRQAGAAADAEHDHVRADLLGHAGDHVFRLAHVAVDILARQAAHAPDQVAVREVLAVLVGVDHVVLGPEVVGQELAALEDLFVHLDVNRVLGLGVDGGQHALVGPVGALVANHHVAAGMAHQVPLRIGDAALVFGGGLAQHDGVANITFRRFLD
jgi:hypothetical protein